MGDDMFGFGAARNAGGEGPEADGLDLGDFKPEPKSVDRGLAEEGRAVGAQHGIRRREPLKSREAPRPEPVPTPKKGGGRIKVTEAYQRKEDRYSGVPRAQLNALAPVPVVQAWKRLAEELGVEQWRMIEDAIPLLRKKHGLADDKAPDQAA